MERRDTPPTLMDGYIAGLGDPKVRGKLSKLAAAIDWEALAGPIRATYGNGTAKGGRPNVPPPGVVKMLKVLMLQKWFNLSEPAMEGILLDRISFREFVGLNMADGTIDETTIVKFRRRLEEQGVFCGMIERRVRGQKELTAEQKAHNKLCASFRAYVEHPFAWINWIKKAGGFARARYRGLRRNALDFGLAAIAYNLERSLSLSAAGR